MSLSVQIRHDLGGFDLDLGFEAPAGITVLFGRSGAGKSSAMNAVAGLLRPGAGRIVLNDRVLFDAGAGVFVPPHRRRLGVVFQEGRLFPHLSVAGNLAYGQRFVPGARLRRGERDRIVDMLGLGPLLTRWPATLSGGEKQRVAIGRALLCQPDMILADEPLAALDDERKGEIQPYFEWLRDELAVPMLYVTHALGEVARLASTVVMIEAGRVTAQGPAQAVLADARAQAATPRALGAVLDTRVRAQHGDGLCEVSAGGVTLFVPATSAPVGGRLRVRIPAHEVILARAAPRDMSALNVLPGTVDTVVDAGADGVVVTLATPAGPVPARITRRSADALGLAPGMACDAIVKSLAIARGDTDA